MPRKSASISRAAPIRASASYIPFVVSMRTIKASRTSALTTVSGVGSEGMSSVSPNSSRPVMKCCSLAETARRWNVGRSCSLRLRGVDDGVAARGQKLDRRRSATVDRQVDQHLADDGGELEPVPRKAGAERNMLVV